MLAIDSARIGLAIQRIVGELTDLPRGRSCKVSVIASPTGIVTRLNTEDAEIYVGLTAAVRIEGSLCATRLDTPHATATSTYCSMLRTGYAR